MNQIPLLPFKTSHHLEPRGEKRLTRRRHSLPHRKVSMPICYFVVATSKICMFTNKNRTLFLPKGLQLNQKANLRSPLPAKLHQPSRQQKRLTKMRTRRKKICPSHPLSPTHLLLRRRRRRINRVEALKKTDPLQWRIATTPNDGQTREETLQQLEQGLVY